MSCYSYAISRSVPTMRFQIEIYVLSKLVQGMDPTVIFYCYSSITHYSYFSGMLWQPAHDAFICLENVGTDFFLKDRTSEYTVLI
jgi:hypothetical protein